MKIDLQQILIKTKLYTKSIKDIYILKDLETKKAAATFETEIIKKGIRIRRSSTEGILMIIHELDIRNIFIKIAVQYRYM